MPTELLPHVLDHEPAELRMMLAAQANANTAADLYPAAMVFDDPANE
jgi:hypothetical protein